MDRLVTGDLSLVTGGLQKLLPSVTLFSISSYQIPVTSRSGSGSQLKSFEKAVATAAIIHMLELVQDSISWWTYENVCRFLMPPCHHRRQHQPGRAATAGRPRGRGAAFPRQSV